VATRADDHQGSALGVVEEDAPWVTQPDLGLDTLRRTPVVGERASALDDAGRDVLRLAVDLVRRDAGAGTARRAGSR
jgi:hypothetical protein